MPQDQVVDRPGQAICWNQLERLFRNSRSYSTKNYDEKKALPALLGQS